MTSMRPTSRGRVSSTRRGGRRMRLLGLVFRKAPFVRIPEGQSPRSKVQSPQTERRAAESAPYQDGIAGAMGQFCNDADMLGTSLFGYAKNIVQEVVAVGRAGTLVDWEGDFEKRAYATAYRAEDILNWRVERVNGRNVPTMIVLREVVQSLESNVQSRRAAWPMANRKWPRMLLSQRWSSR